MEAASDLEIWRRASETGAAIITKDEDFILLGQRGEGPKVVWVRFGNVTRDALLEKMAAALPQIVAALEAGERVIELR